MKAGLTQEGRGKSDFNREWCARTAQSNCLPHPDLRWWKASGVTKRCTTVYQLVYHQMCTRGDHALCFSRSLQMTAHHTNPVWGTNLLGLLLSFVSCESLSELSFLPPAALSVWVAELRSLAWVRSVGRVSHEDGWWLPSGRWWASSARSESHCVAGYTPTTKHGWNCPHPSCRPRCHHCEGVWGPQPWRGPHQLAVTWLHTAPVPSFIMGCGCRLQI